ncbi:MAG: hypothetical protein IT287_06825 [Bdellovibrionaceae bacterium]|nr:hypothetical protein [Pseudobdellovibrionaceae bacterium]
MKTAVFALTCLFAANVFAQDITNFPTNYPTNWDLAMASLACKAEFPENSVVSKEKTNEGIVLTVKADGVVIAKARTSNSTIFAKKECLFVDVN